MIRPTRPDDLPAIKTIIDRAKLFPSAMLGGMIVPYLAAPDGDAFSLTGEADGAPAAVAFGEPERMAEGVWNLLLVAVHPDRQGRGLGNAIMRHVEALLAGRGARLLLVETSGLETSGLEEFARTRAFYDGLGYAREAVIRDDYAPGDDKIVLPQGAPARPPQDRSRAAE